MAVMGGDALQVPGGIAKQLARLGKLSQQQQWLPALASGERQAALALQEQGARYDWQRVQTRASRSAQGYLLNGRKTLVLHGDSDGTVPYEGSGKRTHAAIAGSEAANASFGVSLKILQEGYDAGLSLKRGTLGDNLMYFETGQGSALSAGAHHGLDQQTCETRAYAVARHFKPFLVNTVVGFIGPEYLYNGKQIIRAGLEDHFCGKLLGLPMGCDICYTNHAEADQDDMDVLLTLLGVAGINFIMGIPGSDDVMLNYQTTSFHDALYARQSLGLKPAPEFEAWLQRMGIFTQADGRPRMGNSLPPAFRQALAQLG